MRIIFMGTPEFALPSLKTLIDNGFNIVGIVTAPDKPSGRGLKLSYSPVKIYAIEQRLPVMQPVDMRDRKFTDQLRAVGPDLFVVVAFRILPPDVFRIPRMGSFNLHASLLPKYRGAAPINWAIIRGDTETGVTTFFLNEKVDTGDVILQARLPIGPDETAGELHDRLALVGSEIVFHTVRLIESGKAYARSQDKSTVTSAPKIIKEYCRLDWQKPAREIHNLIRGLSPQPGAFTFLGSGLLKIYRSRIASGTCGGKPGEIIRADSQLIVATVDGAIEILEIQKESGKKLNINEFLRGFRLETGKILC